MFRARVVDFALDSLTIEITGGEEKIDRLLEVLRPYGILEMVRTGVVAMRRGTKSEEEAAAAPRQLARGCRWQRRGDSRFRRQCFLLGLITTDGSTRPAA